MNLFLGEKGEKGEGMGGDCPDSKTPSPSSDPNSPSGDSNNSKGKQLKEFYNMNFQYASMHLYICLFLIHCPL